MQLFSSSPGQSGVFWALGLWASSPAGKDGMGREMQSGPGERWEGVSFLRTTKRWKRGRYSWGQGFGSSLSPRSDQGGEKAEGVTAVWLV